MLKPVSPTLPDAIDTGWDDLDAAAVAPPPEPLSGSAGIGSSSTALDSGWDELDGNPVSKRDSPSSVAPPMDVVDAGWDEQKPPSPLPTEGRRNRGRRPSPRSETLAAPAVSRQPTPIHASSLIPLTKKQRRELERKQRAQVAQVKAQRKEQRKLERQGLQKVVQERASPAQKPASVKHPSSRNPHKNDAKAAVGEAPRRMQRTASPVPTLERTSPSSSVGPARPRPKPRKGASERSQSSNFGRVSLLVLFALLMAAVAFAFRR